MITRRTLARRPRAVALTAVLALLLTGAGTPATAGTTAMAGAPAIEGVGPAGWRGVPVRREALPAAIRLAGAGASWKLHYLTTSWRGRPTVVTGTLAVPAGRPPAAGWPVVSFGHGFGGGADACAPSTTGPSPWERAVQEALLAAGYAVAVTDFEGIGTPAESPGVNGPASAYNMIDIVRAARRTAPVSRSWASVGYSLGGYSALFTASIAATYAPELRHTGSIALAPVTQWGLQLDSPAFSDPAAPLNHTVPYSARALAVTRGVTLADHLTPTGLALVDLAGRACIGEMIAAAGGVTNGRFYRDTAAFSALFRQAMVPAMEVPAARYPRPVRVAHGTLDELPIALSQITVGQLAAAGTDATLTPVVGADHIDLLPRVAPQVVAWTGELFGIP